MSTPNGAPSPENPYQAENWRPSEALAPIGEFVAEKYHGWSAAIAERRVMLAGSTMERMEHKNALYSDLGALALTGERTETATASGEPAMPRTSTERFFDKQLDRHSLEKARADTYAYRAQTVFGPRESLTGMNNDDRQENRQRLQDQVQKGQMLAGEARVWSTRVGAEPLKFGETMHNISGEKQRKAGKKIDLLIKQPVIAAHRDKRLVKSIDNIQTRHASAERHGSEQSRVIAQREQRHRDAEERQAQKRLDKFGRRLQKSGQF